MIMNYCSHYVVAVLSLLISIVSGQQHAQQYFPTIVQHSNNINDRRDPAHSHSQQQQQPQQQYGANNRVLQQQQLYPTSTTASIVRSTALNECPRLESPYDGYVMMTGLYHGATAYYTCQNTRYQPLPSSVRYCMFGSWTGVKPMCRSHQMVPQVQTPPLRRKVCPSLLPPHNGFVTIISNGNNYTAMYRCFSGFSLQPSKNELRHCQSNGLWSGITPSCERVPTNCDEPGIPMNGACKLNSTLEGGVLICKCCEMCKLIGSSVRMCMSDGKWSGMQPVCIQDVECPPLKNLTNGHVMFTSVGAGAVATYSCNDDFDLTGNTVRICQANRQWSGYEPSCEIASSSVVSIDNIILSESPVLSVACEAPYPPENGYVLVNNESTHTAEYKCNEGYDLKGISTRVCQSDGTWSDNIPICQKTRVPCETPYPPEHGYIVVTNQTDTMNTSTVEYTCKKGYDLKGVRTRVCLSDGKWSGRIPECQEISCGDLVHPDNGRVYYTAISLHAVALYRCSRGYRMIGDMRRTCENNYKWSGSAPKCQMMQVVTNRFFCPRLAPPQNANVKMSGVIIGSKAKYTCRSQLYQLIGDDVRICSRGGEWSGEEPRCVMAVRRAYAIQEEDIFIDEEDEVDETGAEEDRNQEYNRGYGREYSREYSRDN